MQRALIPEPTVRLTFILGYWTLVSLDSRRRCFRTNRVAVDSGIGRCSQHHQEMLGFAAHLLKSRRYGYQRTLNITAWRFVLRSDRPSTAGVVINGLTTGIEER